MAVKVSVIIPVYNVEKYLQGMYRQHSESDTSRSGTYLCR